MILNVVAGVIVSVESIFGICTVNVVNMIVVAEISDEQANETKILTESLNNFVFFFSVMENDDVESVDEATAIVCEEISNDDEVRSIVSGDEARRSANDDVVTSTLNETGKNTIWKRRWKKL